MYNNFQQQQQQQQQSTPHANIQQDQTNTAGSTCTSTNSSSSSSLLNNLHRRKKSSSTSISSPPPILDQNVNITQHNIESFNQYILRSPPPPVPISTPLFSPSMPMPLTYSPITSSPVMFNRHGAGSSFPSPISIPVILLSPGQPPSSAIAIVDPGIVNHRQQPGAVMHHRNNSWNSLDLMNMNDSFDAISINSTLSTPLDQHHVASFGNIHDHHQYFGTGQSITGTAGGAIQADNSMIDSIMESLMEGVELQDQVSSPHEHRPHQHQQQHHQPHQQQHHPQQQQFQQFQQQQVPVQYQQQQQYPQTSDAMTMIPPPPLYDRNQNDWINSALASFDSPTAMINNNNNNNPSSSIPSSSALANIPTLPTMSQPITANTHVYTTVHVDKSNEMCLSRNINHGNPDVRDGGFSAQTIYNIKNDIQETRIKFEKLDEQQQAVESECTDTDCSCYTTDSPSSDNEPTITTTSTSMSSNLLTTSTSTSTLLNTHSTETETQSTTYDVTTEGDVDDEDDNEAGEADEAGEEAEEEESEPVPAPHRAPGPYLCTHPNCSKSYATSQRLRAHRRIHRRQRKHACSHPNCDAIFFRWQDLKRHGLTHSRVRAVVCELCQARFTRQDALNRHLKLGRCPMLKE
ncbi:hypothetical protein HDU76_001864 [Blyttiomyces sp. JEL0837]|nr:hypothetical protein HDU76_001864 [Blyttiomyces sp. JEL0837]